MALGSSEARGAADVGDPVSSRGGLDSVYIADAGVFDMDFWEVDEFSSCSK